jgi:hypothetical protein
MVAIQCTRASFAPYSPTLKALKKGISNRPCGNLGVLF